MKNHERLEEHKRLDALHVVLKELESLLSEPSKKGSLSYSSPKQPPLFILGNPRSGTTWLYQMLAASGQFAYPSNIMSRFYYAPYIGSLIHKMFKDYDKLNELCGADQIQYTSKLGKTEGAISPHEFWGFWRRFFPISDIQKLSNEDIKDIDIKSFKQELAAIEGVFGLPVLMKAMYLNWNIDLLHCAVPNALMVFVKRDPLQNMRSLYQARLDFFGDLNKWYSFKTPEYPALIKEDIYTQLAGQVVYTNKNIDAQLKHLPDINICQVSYESLSQDPQNELTQIASKLKKLGFDGSINYSTPDVIDKTRQSRQASDFSEDMALEALYNIQNKQL